MIKKLHSVQSPPRQRKLENAVSAKNLFSNRKLLHDHENLLFTAARNPETRRATEAHRSPQRLEEPIDLENKQPRSSSRTPKHKEFYFNNARFKTEEEKEPLEGAGQASGEDAFIGT